MRGLLVVAGVVAGKAHSAHVEALTAASPAWSDGLMTRRVPLSDYASALQPGPDDVKTIINLTA